MQQPLNSLGGSMEQQQRQLCCVCCVTMQSERGAEGEQLISGHRTATLSTITAHLCAKTRFVAGNRWKENLR